MKFSKIAKKFAAAALAGVLAVSMMGMSVNADGTGNVTGTVSFTKTLDMSGAVGASVPNVTFEYEITTDGLSEISATDNNPEILVGVGSPIVGTAEYTSSDTAGGSVEKTVYVDFTNVTFSAPGIYRYVITEKESSVSGVTDDTNDTRYLDVYVTNGETTGTYVISYYVLLTNDETPTISTVEGVTYATYTSSLKSEGYTNIYTTQSLTLSKEVTGSMADLSKTFSFTISFTNGPANGSFTYKLNGVEQTSVSLNDNGEGSVTVTLGNSTGSAVITGIPENVKYTITETVDSTNEYTTTYVINSDSSASGISTGEQTVVEGTDVTVTFTNTKDAITATGIAISIAPYVLMVAFAGVIAFLFLRKRNYEI